MIRAWWNRITGVTAANAHIALLMQANIEEAAHSQSLYSELLAGREQLEANRIAIIKLRGALVRVKGDRNALRERLRESATA